MERDAKRPRKEKSNKKKRRSSDEGGGSGKKAKSKSSPRAPRLAVAAAGEAEFYSLLGKFWSKKEIYESCLPNKKPLTGVIFKGQTIDLFALWNEVQKYGGFDAVEKSRASSWKTVSQKAT